MKYVDSLINYRGDRSWCHLVADDEEELHEFARSIGLKGSWFQGKSYVPHYDLTESKRKRAVALGAKELTRDKFATKIREIHDKTQDKSPGE